MLVEEDWLINHLEDEDLVLIDSRGTIPYRFGHIKNSIPFGIENVISISSNGANLVINEDQAKKVFGSLGINDSKKVVIYGEYLDPSVARIAWTLNYYGHLNTKVLNSSFALVNKNGKIPIVKDISKPKSTEFNPIINHKIRASEEQIKSRLNDDNVIIIDSRTPQEHFQARIPGSKLHNWEDGLGDNGKMFLSFEELSEMFKQADISSDKEIICYCHSGTRASHKFFQFQLASFDNVKLYDGSIIDWAQRKNPLR